MKGFTNAGFIFIDLLQLPQSPDQRTVMRQFLAEIRQAARTPTQQLKTDTGEEKPEVMSCVSHVSVGNFSLLNSPALRAHKVSALS